jgi:hypothetical protein
MCGRLAEGSDCGGDFSRVEIRLFGTSLLVFRVSSFEFQTLGVLETRNLKLKPP